MRFTINAEFTDEELRKYAEDVGRRWMLNFIHDGIAHLGEMKVDPAILGVLQQAIAAGFNSSRAQAPTGPVPESGGPVPGSACVPPFDPGSPPLDRCFPVDDSPYVEEGWGCHCCRTYNGKQRANCRHCGHGRCKWVAPPAPSTVGVVDAESAVENLRIQNLVNQRRAGVAVQLSIDDLLLKYDTILKYWPANTLDIGIRRATGTPAQWMITTRPESGAELYAALEALHGQSKETEYKVTFYDVNKKEIRGLGRITMPDRRSAAVNRDSAVGPTVPPEGGSPEPTA